MLQATEKSQNKISNQALKAFRRARPRCVIGDGDTGFGGSSNIRRTVRGYAAAGALCFRSSSLSCELLKWIPCYVILACSILADSMRARKGGFCKGLTCGVSKGTKPFLALLHARSMDIAAADSVFEDGRVRGHHHRGPVLSKEMRSCEGMLGFAPREISIAAVGLLRICPLQLNQMRSQKNGQRGFVPSFARSRHGHRRSIAQIWIGGSAG